MEEDYQRALELSFTYGYGFCVFKHNIYGDQLEILDCMPDSPNFLSPECFVSLRCPPVSTSSEDAAAKVHCREVAEELRRGVPLGDLNGTSTFSSSFSSFHNGPNMAALLLSYFSVVAPIFGHISSCN